MEARFATSFDTWRRILAAVPPQGNARTTVFTNAASDVAFLLAQGLERTEAADQLASMALEAGLDDADTVQAIVATAFSARPAAPVSAKSNGLDTAKPAPKLVMLNVLGWDGVPAPARSWAVPGRVPDRNVTLLTGDGGVGKTLIVMQLAVATVLGRDWLGVMAEPGPVLFITAEDDADELHFRMQAIVRHYGTRFSALGDLHLVSLAGKDAVMATTDNRGIVRPTPLFEQLAATTREIRPRWVGIDTAADCFIVDERDRSQVRQCISLLRGLALAANTAILLLSHPSLTGMSTGTGLSGSTAWNNSVRSRLYLTTPQRSKDDKEAADEDEVRVLEVMKSNYGPTGEQVRLTWQDGLLLNAPTMAPLQQVALDDSARSIFKALLQRYNKEDMVVSSSPTARNFAPTVFAGLPEARQLGGEAKRRKLLRQAMDYLFTHEKIYNGQGPLSAAPSRRSQCLYTKGDLL